VVFKNYGTYTLTLTSSEGLFEDKFLNNDQKMNYIFKKTGTFNFYLKDEKSLIGTIIVEP
jgi:plastocyanin